MSLAKNDTRVSDYVSFFREQTRGLIDGDRIRFDRANYDRTSDD